jgi:AbrB family looped-hinge helix DNA binding protein
MASISITKMSSKGQVVIPQDMREDIEEGEKLVVIKNDKQIILEKMENFDKNLEEDLEFAKRTEGAWKQVDEGKFTSYSKEEFLKELENGSQ